MTCLKSLALVLSLLASLGYAAEPAQLSSEQSGILEAARASAMQYKHLLPDFICTQITHRTTAKSMSNSGAMGTGISGRGTIASMANASGYSSDVIEEQLTYVGGKENYEVLSLNGRKAVGKDHMQFAGATSAGEFGSMLEEVFDPASHTTFTWSHTASMHGKRAWVYDFVVPRESGTEVIARDTDKEALVSISGQVFIDPETKDVLQITSKLDLPPNFPIKLAQRTIEFGPREIGGKSYSLPTRSLVHMEEGSESYDNRIEFKNYHRFASESTIHFDNENQQQ